MGQVRTSSADIKKRLAARRDKREKERSKKDHGQKRLPAPDKDDAIEVVSGEVQGDFHTWPTRSDAARRAGISRSTLIRLQNAGDLNPIQDEDGQWRFDPEELDIIASEKGTDASQAMAEAVGTVVRTASDLTKGSQQHAQAFADNSLEMSQVAFEQMRLMSDTLIEENKDLRLHIRELEAERKEAVKHIDEAQTTKHKRDLERHEIERKEKRIDWAMNTFFMIAGPAILSKMGLSMPGQVATPSGETPALPTGSDTPAQTVTSDGTEKVLTEADLQRLELNLMILIADIDEQRFKMLCAAATPVEVEALTEIRKTVTRIRAQAKAVGEKDGKGSPTQG